MSTPELVVQRELLSHVKDSQWDVRGHFSDLFTQLMPAELLQNPRMTVVDELFTEDTLPAAMNKTYEKDGYAVLFYTHKTHSGMTSPFNNDKNPTHTSLLLCKVEHGKINGVLNVDGYHYLGYMDIIGERPGARRNPLIPNRMVVQAPDLGGTEPQPIQNPSWNNLNCVLYTFSFAQAIVNAFDVMPYILDGLFDGKNVSKAGLSDLQETILNGIEGTHTKRVGNTIYRAPDASQRYHAQVRETLASTLQARFERAKQAVVEPVVVVAKSTDLVEEVASPEVVLPPKDQAVKSPTATVTLGLTNVVVEEPVVQTPAKSEVVLPEVEASVVTDKVINLTDPSQAPVKGVDAEHSAKVLRQSVAAIDAVENREPAPTPSLLARFVNSIANMLKGIWNAMGNFFDNVATRIGIKG